MPDHKLSTQCRVCGGPIQAFMTFGRMPIANGFLKQSEVVSEYFFERSRTPGDLAVWSIELADLEQRQHLPDSEQFAVPG